MAGGVAFEAESGLLYGGDVPAHGVFFVDAGQLDHATVLAERLGQSFERVPVIQLHTARVERDADEVGNEQEQRLRIGRTEIAVARGELFPFLRLVCGAGVPCG